jgi:hypothetical protein
MSRVGNKSVWWAVSMLAVIVAAVSGYTLHHSTNPQTELSTLPNDNFSVATQQRIDAVVTSQSMDQTNHRVYIVTGGLGMANPRIMTWDSTGDIAFGQPNGPVTFDIEQFGPGFQNLTMNGKPIPWIKKQTDSGVTYYEYVWSPNAPYSPVWYYFEKGNMYIRLTISGSKDVYPFPQGLLTHLR